MRIILASQSIFRRKALEILGLEFQTMPSDLDEDAIQDADPMRRAQMLSEAKARAIGEIEKDALIIAGDLFVVFNGRTYEKPGDLAEAREMLQAFSGKEHEMVAGVAVLNSKTGKMASAAERCSVRFRTLSDYEINDYVSRYPVLKFSGAYDNDGIMRFAEHVEGNLLFIAGFPVDRLIGLLRQQGLNV